MKKNNLPLLLIVFFISLHFSCKKTCCCTNVDLNLQINYTDKNGNTLLDSSENFKTDSIEIYTRKNGVLKRSFDASWTDPKGFNVVESNGKKIFLTSAEDFMIIEFNKTIRDTIECKIEDIECGVTCTEVKYNGIVKWNSRQKPRAFDVVK
jgi:hypothetical protein